MVIGISLMRVGINWAGGGLPTLTKVVDGVPGAFPNPGYGQLQGLGIALFVLLVILGLIKWGSGFVANVSVLLGIVAGAILASLLGVMHFDKVAAASWAAVVIPFHFGMPQFHLVPIITMCIVMIVVMIESLGMFLALGEITGKKVDREALTAACAPTASARCSAACSIPSPTRRSRRMSASSASPACARAGSP